MRNRIRGLRRDVGFFIGLGDSFAYKGKIAGRFRKKMKIACGPKAFGADPRNFVLGVVFRGS
jgi:translation initiation factor IF-1